MDQVRTSLSKQDLGQSCPASIAKGVAAIADRRRNIGDRPEQDERIVF